ISSIRAFLTGSLPGSLITMPSIVAGLVGVVEFWASALAARTAIRRDEENSFMGLGRGGWGRSCDRGDQPCKSHFIVSPGLNQEIRRAAGRASLDWNSRGGCPHISCSQWRGDLRRGWLSC